MQHTLKLSNLEDFMSKSFYNLFSFFFFSSFCWSSTKYGNLGSTSCFTVIRSMEH